MPMPDKVKITIFGAVVIIATALIVALVVHRSYTRNRLCENGGEVFYEDPETKNGSCIRAGMQGPCGKNMVLVSDKRDSSGKGVCGCDVDHFDRTMIFHGETNQCYFIFTQAFCEPGKWLVVTKIDGPKCDTRICPDPEPRDIGREIVPLSDGRCVDLLKYDNVTCNKSEVVKFFKKKIYPACRNLGTSIGSVGVPPTDCPDGFFSTGVGHCQPDFDFD